MIGQTTPGRRNMFLAYLVLAIAAVAALTPVDADPAERAEVAFLTGPRGQTPELVPFFKH